MMADYSYNQVTPNLSKHSKKSFRARCLPEMRLMQIILMMKCQSMEKEHRRYWSSHYNGGRCSNRKAVL